MVDEGWALASLQYHFSHEALFPAQIHQCKAAIRWLRAQATRFGFNAERIGVLGASAGGHLAALLGTSNGQAALEGDLGEHRDQSSAVQAVVDLFGPTDFARLSDHPSDLTMPRPTRRKGSCLAVPWRIIRTGWPWPIPSPGFRTTPVRSSFSMVGRT